MLRNFTHRTWNWQVEFKYVSINRKHKTFIFKTAKLGRLRALFGTFAIVCENPKFVCEMTFFFLRINNRKALLVGNSPHFILEMQFLMFSFTSCSNRKCLYLNCCMCTYTRTRPERTLPFPAQSRHLLFDLRCGLMGKSLARGVQRVDGEFPTKGDTHPHLPPSNNFTARINLTWLYVTAPNKTSVIFSLKGINRLKKTDKKSSIVS